MIKTIFLTIILISTNFLLSEAIVRYETFGSNGLIPEMLESIVTIKNSRFAYNYTNCGIIQGLVPGQEGINYGVPFKVNSMGIRDKEYQIEKDEDTFRIILIGSSYSLGRGIKMEDLYHSKVEEMLNERDSRYKFEIMNFAYEGEGKICLLKNLKTTK